MSIAALFKISYPKLETIQMSLNWVDGRTSYALPVGTNNKEQNKNEKTTAATGP